LGGSPRFPDHPYARYVRAARDALAAARSDDRSWSSLLAHLDNNAAHAIELLAGMLSTRDQWLREIIPEEPKGLRTRLEATLSAEIEGVLLMLKDRFPAELSAALVPLARHAVANVASSPDNAALAQALEICVQQGGLPPATVAALEHWRHLARWLLRSGNNTFLKMVNTRHGFPAGRTALGIDNRGAKLAMHVFLAELTDVPGLAAMLDVVRRLPPPCYSDESWRIVESLLAVLPQVAAQLTITFRDNGAIDFTHGMLAALSALGRSDEPGELLLRMDFVLEHLLIDEFQDISYTQLDLIRRLT